jgi:hypothetical protein
VESLESLFGTNHTHEQSGVDFVIERVGATFTLKRWGGSNTTEMQKKMMKHYKPVAALIEKDLLPSDKREAIEARVFVESCLVGWKGVKLGGKEVPFTVENAIDLFKKLPDLKELLVKYASDADNFKSASESEKVALGNS